MSKFFKSADKIQVGQTEVSVPSENGLQYRPNGKIDIYIPPTSKFVDLSQSKLKFNVSLAIPTVDTDTGATRVQLDAQTGLHSLIRSIRVFSGRKTVLLEEIEGYDILTALRFDYETNENLRNKRALTDGSTVYDPACRSTRGSLKSQQGNCFSNPYFTKVQDVNSTLNTSFATTDVDYDFHVATGELHLNTGLFRNEAVFPALLTDGLFIEILLQDSKRVFRTLDSGNRNRHLRLNPIFHSTNGSDAQDGKSGSWVDGGTTNEIFLTRDNNMTSTQVCPFVVGEKIAVTSVDNLSASLSTVGTISQIEQVTGATVGTSKIKITTHANMTNNAGEDIGASYTGTDYVVVSANLQDNGDITSYDPTYTVKNVEMIVKQIEVPAGYEQSMMNMMKEGGTIN